jgi:hypothetical protein
MGNSKVKCRPAKMFRQQGTQVVEGMIVSGPSICLIFSGLHILRITKKTEL